MESIQIPQNKKSYALSLGHAYNTKMELLKNIYMATHMKVKVKSLIEIFV